MNITGAGFVSLFAQNGTFIRRIATGGTLAAPYGLSVATESLGNGTQGKLLVGNLADGLITAYSLAESGSSSFGFLLNPFTAFPGMYGTVFTASTDVPGGPYLYFVSNNGTQAQGIFGQFAVCCGTVFCTSAAGNGSTGGDGGTGGSTNGTAGGGTGGGGGGMLSG